MRQPPGMLELGSFRREVYDGGRVAGVGPVSPSAAVSWRRTRGRLPLAGEPVHDDDHIRGTIVLRTRNIGMEALS